MCFRLWCVYWVLCSVCTEWGSAARHQVHTPQPETHWQKYVYLEVFLSILKEEAQYSFESRRQHTNVHIVKAQKGFHFQAMKLSLRARDGLRTCTKNPDEQKRKVTKRETTEPEILCDVNEHDIVQSVLVTGLKAGRPMRSSSIPLSGEKFRSSRQIPERLWGSPS